MTPIRTCALLLALALAATATRDIVCQLACAEPDAAHAAATCHESSSLATPAMQDAQAHCLADATSPATIAVKLTTPKDDSPLVLHSPTPATLAPRHAWLTQLDESYPSRRSTPGHRFVLRI